MLRLAAPWTRTGGRRPRHYCPRYSAGSMGTFLSANPP